MSSSGRDMKTANQPEYALVSRPVVSLVAGQPMNMPLWRVDKLDMVTERWQARSSVLLCPASYCGRRPLPALDNAIRTQ